METQEQLIERSQPAPVKINEETSPPRQSQVIPPSGFLLFKTWTQRFLGHIVVIPFCGVIAFLMGTVRNYRIENRDQIRRQFREIVKTKSPLIICSNHLTFIDSCLIIWALASNSWYFFNYRFFTWNLPAGDFFKKKLRYRLVAYFSKCIFIDRKGTRDHKNEVLGLCRYLVQKGEVLTIFPEGQRSRTGFFNGEHLTRGTGRIIADQPDCRVLCIYVRGHNQTAYSGYPPKGARFHLLTKLIVPHSELAGAEKEIDLVNQIGQTIQGLEHAYFNSKQFSVQ